MSLIAGSYEKYIWGFKLKPLETPYLALTPLFSYPSHQSPITTVAACGHVAASGGADDTIHLYDLPSASYLGSLHDHSSSLTSLSFYSPPNLSFPRNLISAASDGSVSIFDADPFVLLKSIRPHRKAINDLSVHPSGKLALTVARDECLAMLNLVRGRRSFCCRLGREASLVKFDLGGDRFFMVVEDKVGVHEAEDARLLCELENPKQKRVLCAAPAEESMDNDSNAWNDNDNIEENDTSEEGSSSNASSTIDFDTWAEWYAWSSRNDGTEEAVLLLGMLMEEQQFHAQRRMPRPQHNIGLRGYQYIIAVLNGHPDTCYEMFRMEVYAFRRLCDRLRSDDILRDSSREVTVEEALGMFCYTVGHGVVQRNAANLFQHSVETINRHVYNVMRALCRLSRRVIKRSQTTGVMPYIEGNPRLYPWFEKCHGAMDGVMIHAAAPGSVANAYLNRNHRISQNVLCVCDFDMKFTFVYSGWEGTAHDARVLIDALSRPDNHFPWPEEGYYYLVDSAFPCTEGFMPPYPRVRYHRSERRGSRTFQGYKDLFNYRHSSLRNVIERAFGVLKKRFRILNLMPPYLLTRQRYLIIACCTIHNFIRMVTPNDQDFLAYSNPDDYPGMDADHNTSEEAHVPDMSTASAQAMAATRDAIALPMWEHTYGQQGNT